MSRVLLHSGVCPAHPQTLGVTLCPAAAAACALPRPALKSDHPAARPCHGRKSQTEIHTFAAFPKGEKSTRKVTVAFLSPVLFSFFPLSVKREQRPSVAAFHSRSAQRQLYPAWYRLAERHVRRASPGDCGAPRIGQDRVGGRCVREEESETDPGPWLRPAPAFLKRFVYSFYLIIRLGRIPAL